MGAHICVYAFVRVRACVIVCVFSVCVRASVTVLSSVCTTYDEI